MYHVICHVTCLLTGSVPVSTVVVKAVREGGGRAGMSDSTCRAPVKSALSGVTSVVRYVALHWWKISPQEH